MIAPRESDPRVDRPENGLMDPREMFGSVLGPEDGGVFRTAPAGEPGRLDRAHKPVGQIRDLRRDDARIDSPRDRDARLHRGGVDRIESRPGDLDNAARDEPAQALGGGPDRRGRERIDRVVEPADAPPADTVPQFDENRIEPVRPVGVRVRDRPHHGARARDGTDPARQRVDGDPEFGAVAREPVGEQPEGRDALRGGLDAGRVESREDARRARVECGLGERVHPLLGNVINADRERGRVARARQDAVGPRGRPDEGRLRAADSDALPEHIDDDAVVAEPIGVGVPGVLEPAPAEIGDLAVDHPARGIDRPVGDPQGLVDEIAHEDVDRGALGRGDEVAGAVGPCLDAGDLDDRDLVEPRGALVVLPLDLERGVGVQGVGARLFEKEFDLQRDRLGKIARDTDGDVLPLAPGPDRIGDGLRPRDWFACTVEQARGEAGPRVDDVLCAHAGDDGVVRVREDLDHPRVEQEAGGPALGIEPRRAGTGERDAVIDDAPVPDREAGADAGRRVVLGADPVLRQTDRVAGDGLEDEAGGDAAGAGGGVERLVDRGLGRVRHRISRRLGGRQAADCERSDGIKRASHGMYHRPGAGVSCIRDANPTGDRA